MDRETLNDCIRLCWDARHACQDTLFRHCLPIGGMHLDEPHVRLMVDCIQICQTTADFMTRDSAMNDAVLPVCAEICQACAKACERIGDEAMMRCVAACLKCAKRCRELGSKLKAAA